MSLKDWLEGLKLDQYLQNFTDQGFEGLDDVTDLTDSDLKSLGVELPGHRSRLLKNLPDANGVPPPRPAAPKPPAAAPRPVSADEFGLNSVLNTLGDLVDGLDEHLAGEADEPIAATNTAPEAVLSETVDQDLDSLLEDLCDFSFDIGGSASSSPTKAEAPAASAVPPRPSRGSKPTAAGGMVTELQPMNATVTELKPANAPMVTELKPANAPMVTELKPANAPTVTELKPANASAVTELKPANASDGASGGPPSIPKPFSGSIPTTSLKGKPLVAASVRRPPRTAADVQARLNDYRQKLVSGTQGVSVGELDQLMKEEKIRIAMEKLAEASVLKLVLKVYNSSGTSKTLAIESTQTARDICSKLVLKNRVQDDPTWAVVEVCPSLHIERVLEDHESVGDLYNAWPSECDWKFVFRRQHDKYALFSNPEKFLPSHLKDDLKDLAGKAERAKRILLKEFFSNTTRVPDLKGFLQEKDGTKKWKKRYFILRASGLYYSNKGESEASKDLVCYVSFNDSDTFVTQGPKEHYKSPTTNCLTFRPILRKQAVKHNQLKHVCFASEDEYNQWSAGIRLAKYGMILRTNHEDTARKFDQLVKLGVASQSVPEAPKAKPKHDTAAAQQWKASRAAKGTNRSAATGVSWEDDRASMYDLPWYHGTIGREETTALFRARGFIEGCYLIRDSASHPGDYVLSLCFGNTPRHFRIRTVKDGSNPDQYQLDDGPKFKTLGHLVKHYYTPQKQIPTRLLAAVHRAA